MTAARRTIVTPTAVTPTSRNIATRIGNTSPTRDKCFLFHLNGQIWQYSGYQASVYRTITVSYDYDLNVQQQGLLEKGSDRTYANGNIVEVSGRYFAAFMTLAATREHGIVELDTNLDIVGTNYVFWDDGGANNSLVDLTIVSDSTHIYALSRNGSENALTLAKFDTSLTLIDSDKISTNEEPYGCCVDDLGNIYFCTSSTSGIYIYTYDSTFTMGDRYFCPNVDLMKKTAMASMIWRNGVLYCAVIGRNEGGVEDFVLFKIPDDFSSFDRVNANAISNQENAERTGQVSMKSNGNIVVSSTYRNGGILRPVLFEFDNSLSNLSQIIATNVTTTDTGCVVSNGSVYWAYHRGGSVDIFRLDDMAYPNPTTPPCSTVTLQDTSYSFTVYNGLLPTSYSPSAVVASVNETVGTLTDGSDMFVQEYNCEFTP